MKFYAVTVRGHDNRRLEATKNIYLSSQYECKQQAVRNKQQ